MVKVLYKIKSKKHRSGVSATGGRGLAVEREWIRINKNSGVAQR